MDIESIKKVLDSATGQSLKEYLQLKLAEMKDIENVADLSTPSHHLIEFKATRKAYKKVKEILENIMTFSEEARKKDPRDSYEIK